MEQEKQIETCGHEELRHYSDGDSIAVCENQKPCAVHDRKLEMQTCSRCTAER